MRAKVAIFHLVLASSFALPGFGCGRGNQAGGETVLDQSDVEQVGKMLRMYQKGLKPPTKGPKDYPVFKSGPVPPPRGTRDILPMAKGFPKAVNAIRDRKVLLYWKTDLSDDPEASSTILAFRKDVPDQGGQVLMRDGTVKSMTASQFQAAKKPEGTKTEDEKPASNTKK